jgi:protocatechuate 3,4-dioxygenase beta subunit
MLTPSSFHANTEQIYLVNFTNGERIRMNRKILFSVVTGFSMIVLSACTSASPASTTIPTDKPIPASTHTTSANATEPSGNTFALTRSNLACANGSTSISTTPELTEGPYYKSGSPEAATLYQEGMPGTKLVLTGYVYDTNCKPVANAWLDFWQADANGQYDNSGYTLRGHQYTDTNGFYTLTTVVPGLYPGRTEHIHFKVQAPNGQTITSQLFFPGVTQNDSDGIFNESLVLPIQETSDGMQAQFNFVVPAQ